MEDGLKVLKDKGSSLNSPSVKVRMEDELKVLKGKAEVSSLNSTSKGKDSFHNPLMRVKVRKVSTVKDDSKVSNVKFRMDDELLEFVKEFEGSSLNSLNCENIISFNAQETIDKYKYKQFIEDLRNLRKDITQKIISHQPQSDPPLNWMYIHLICGIDKNIVLKIDPRNLYIHLYFIGCCDEYHYIDPTQFATTATTICPLGYSPLKHAIRFLINPLKVVEADAFMKRWTEAALGMMVISQMITEAARIELIAEHVFQNWETPSPITLEMQSIRKALIRGTFSSPMAEHVTECSSNTSYVRPLVSIDYILVKNIGEGKNAREISGAVVVEDVWDDYVVYDLDDGEIKGPGDYISLTGPLAPVVADDPFRIFVSLWDHDDEFAKGDIVFNPIVRTSCKYFDKQLEKDVSGKLGSVIVGYSVIRKAYSATIEVVMMNESSTNVHGTIKASYYLKNSGLSTRMLFDQSANEYVQVSAQQSMSLTRPVFPVPVENFNLTIAVDLWDHDHQIASGNLEFTPVIGTQLRDITGDYGKVQVSITCE